MANYKPRQDHRDGSGLLLGVCIGFLLGVAVAGGIAAYFVKSPVPFLDRPRPPDRAPAANLKDAAKATTSDGKPRFDFYRILPGQEEPVSGEEFKKQAAREKAGKAAESGSLYFLQAGAFQSPADADNLKARLAFMGLEATVEPTSLPDKGVWYRVRLGPYSKVEDINKARTLLAQNSIDASLVKLRDSKDPPEKQ